jgi:uncharacterized protein YuzE
MKIEYDAEADALYIQLREVAVDDNVDVEDRVTIDLDQGRHIVGLEILDASKRLSPLDLATVLVEGLPSDS